MKGWDEVGDMHFRTVRKDADGTAWEYSVHMTPGSITDVEFEDLPTIQVPDYRTSKEPPMSEYAAILACYRSGQVSERQWQEHMRDEVFAAWVRKQEKTR